MLASPFAALRCRAKHRSTVRAAAAPLPCSHQAYSTYHTTSRSRQRKQTNETGETDARGSTRLSSNRNRKLPNRNYVPKGGEGARTISLLEELFPAETKKQDTTAVPSPAPDTDSNGPSDSALSSERSIPRIAMGTGVPIDTTYHGFPKKPIPAEKVLPTDVPYVLHLRNAGKNLTKDDFKRVVPTSRHIEGWITRGDIKRVIRHRDKHSLVPSGEYLILFDNLRAAQYYRNRAYNMHRWAETYYPRNLQSPIPPAPPMHVKDDDADTEREPFRRLDSYTLAPAGAELNLRLLEPPYRPLMLDIVRRGGYAKLLTDARSAHEVLFWTENFTPTFSGLERAVWKDGQQRGMEWATVGRNRGLRAIWVPLASWVDSKPVEEDDLLDDTALQLRDAKGHRLAKGIRKFIISLADDEEAKRFVLQWHRRNIADLLDWSTELDGVPLVNAEYIW